MLTQTSSRPLYEQLKHTIVADIISGAYAYGDRLPSELSLAAQFGISRITVRRAVAELVEEGYLSSQQGKGTFVDFKTAKQQYRYFGGFSESANDGVKKKSSRIILKETIPANGSLSEKLRVAIGTKVILLRRIMMDGDKPYMLDNAYFIEKMYPGILPLLADNVSTFSIMREKYGVVFARADKTLGVVRAGSEECKLLGCVPGDPLFSITKIIWNEQNIPVHYSHYYVLGDRCVYTISIAGEQPDMELRYQRGE